MSKKLFFLISAAFVVLLGCSKYDDSALQQDIASLDSRVSSLETQCASINTNIATLQTLMQAIQSNLAITAIATTSNGYQITFSNGNTISLNNGANGADGKDGSTPVISVRKDSDGLWYWTVNGSWLLDSEGQKVCAVGKDGATGEAGNSPVITIGTNGNWFIDGDDTGITAQGQKGDTGATGHSPVITIGANGNWFIDGADTGYTAQGQKGDTGETGHTPVITIGANGNWFIDNVDTGYTAQGEKGDTGATGDSFFKSVSYDDNTVTIVLQDGTELSIHRYKEQELDLVFETTEDIFCDYGSTTTVKFSIKGGDAAQIYALGENGWTGDVEFSNSTKSGSITIAAPETANAGKVLVFATDTNGRLIMKALTFTNKLLSIADLSYSVAKAGGTVNVNLSTNLDYSVDIPSSASSWISLITTKAVRNETLNFSVVENTSTLGRSAEIKVKANDGSIVRTIVFYQEGDRYYASGSGTATDPYIVETIGQWENLSIVVANGTTFQDTFFKLGNDLDFNSASISSIGSETYPFSGSFDGNSKTISNVTISGTTNVGLFGYVKNATLHDFNLNAVTVSGSSYKGILAGYAQESTIKNVSASGTVSSGSHIGGIAGYANNTDIDRCQNTGSIGNTSSQYVGGIAGYCTSSNITNSFNHGHLAASTEMGGITGYLDESSSVKNCYNQSQFTQGYLYGTVGGIVGYNCGALSACVYNNTINGTVQGSFSMVGGIVGYDHTTASCQYCYFIKFSILNKNFNLCGDLNWGTWNNCSAYDSSGLNSSGTAILTLLNQWVSSNSTSSMTYKEWTGTYPTLVE